MSRYRILVVTYAYPPSRSVGAVRWGAMSKYLGRLGFDITVITSRLSGGQAQLEMARVIRPADLESSPTLRRALRRSDPFPAAGGADAEGPWWTKVVVPDGYLLTWVPFALRAARREIRDRDVHCVVTTSPPESTHLIGLGVRKLGAAWVTDFRDGWIFEPARPKFARGLDVLDRRLESTVVTRADRVVATSEETAAEFHDRLGVDAVCVPNGWDTDEAPPTSGAVLIGPSGAKRRLVHTGQLGVGTERRQPEPFFAALDRFYKQEPGLAGQLEIVLAGRKTAEDAALLASLRDRTAVIDPAELSRGDALSLQRSADVLLVCANGSRAPLKLFEYLAAGRPILHVGGDGAAARILRETSSGVTVSLDDVDGIVDRLREIALGTFGVDLEPRGIEHYSYAHLAEQMAAVVDDAVARRQAQGT